MLERGKILDRQGKREQAVAEFTQGTPQADDITLLIVRRPAHSPAGSHRDQSPARTLQDRA
ncbi:MAG: hypothetical protein ACE5Q6_20800 [Dehalococcoidia bacterium]